LSPLKTPTDIKNPIEVRSHFLAFLRLLSGEPTALTIFTKSSHEKSLQAAMNLPDNIAVHQLALLTTAGFWLTS
jgi:hypothetical protein